MSGTQPCSTEEALLEFFHRLAIADENRRYVNTVNHEVPSADVKSAKSDSERKARDDEQARELGL